jgi:hypothetical protein
VLDTFATTPSATFHGNAPEGAARLDAASKEALASFLELL